MQYFIGAMIPLVFFLCVGLGYYLGTRRKKVIHEPTDEETKKAAQLKREFDEVMGYTYEKALERKKVT